MKRSGSQQAFTLVELVVAIVFVGVVLGPVLLFVARIHELNHAMGRQGRFEAWRSFNDEAVAAGINPSLAPALMPAQNEAMPVMPALAINTGDVPETMGVARIVPLHVVLDGAVAESRPVGGGFQIGAGGSVPDRTTPAAPLPPIVMPAPTVSPSDGSVVAVPSLAPAGAGEAFTTLVRATAPAGSHLHLVLNQPSSSADGLGVAQRTVTAVDLLNGVNGLAWTEYSGNPDAGDRSVVLGDGRARWLVTTPSGRLQIYEPSRPVSFAYRLGLGAPVLVQGATENPSGTTLSFDYASYNSVLVGTAGLKIDFPQTIRAAFGNQWGAQAIGFQCTFNNNPAPFSGDLSQFFAPDALALWTDSVPIATTVVAPVGAAVDAAAWTIDRTKTALGVPQMSSSADTTGFFSPGQMQFTAPVGPGGDRIGRLSFDNGVNVSTGPALSIPVIP